MAARLLDTGTQLPNAIREEADHALQKVGAYVADGSTEEGAAEPPSTVALFILSQILGAILYAIAEAANYQEIRRNWSHYRCQPSITPFAKFYGHDFTETTNFCIGQAVKEHSAGVITPIYQGLNEVAGVVDGAFSKVSAIETGISGLIGGFKSFMVNFINSFRLLGTRVRMSVILIKEIFQRVYGIFIAFAYAAISAITFGENLVCNPLVTFVAGFAGVDLCCFTRDTRVRMADGSDRPISTLKIGDLLTGSIRVTSVYEFDGRHTDMVSIDGVHVSGNHYLRGPEGRWVRAEDHPDGARTKSVERIWCLATSTNEIPIVGATGLLTFTDYEESDDPAVVAAAQRAAEEALNGPGGHGPTITDFSLGVDSTLMTLRRDGSWCLLSQLQIGDALVSGGVVQGIIHEECSTICRTPAGTVLSAAQLVNHGGRWVRAATLWPSITLEKPRILFQLLVSNNKPFPISGHGEILVIRDYMEWHGPETEAPYEAVLKVT
jgi:hypothetical protein